MKIVHVYSDAAQVGGAAVAMKRIAAADNALGRIAVVVTPNEQTFVRKAEVFLLRGMVKMLYGTAWTTGILHNPCFIARLNSIKADEIHIHRIHGEVMSVSDLLRLRSKVFIHLHDHWFLSGLNPNRIEEISWWKRQVYSQLGFRLTFVAHSAYMYKMAESRVRQFGCTVVYEPIPLPSQYCVDEGEQRGKHILFVTASSLNDPAKGYDRLCEAVKLLKQKGYNPEVKIIRDLTEDELIHEYRRAGVVAFPSRIETLGLVKLEAIACGCPVVAFDETACAEGIDHLKTGYVAKSGNGEDFARGLLYCIGVWRNR